tara:strand:+ start:2860 stop:3048 length:189 start_codon:yes stop_codon:yes gene_type:complete
MSLLIDKISLKDKKTLITFRKQLIDILENIALTLLNHSKKKEFSRSFKNNYGNLGSHVSILE